MGLSMRFREFRTWLRKWTELMNVGFGGDGAEAWVCHRGRIQERRAEEVFVAGEWHYSETFNETTSHQCHNLRN
jgi:hypothetical protein